MNRTRTVLLAGGMGKRMRHLGHRRLKPLIPFGGVCHLIDFSLNNAYRSGIPEVLLLSHYSELQLMRYLLSAWSGKAGFRVHLGPYDGMTLADLDAGYASVSRPAEHGTADALIKNARYIFDTGCSDVMVLHADHVYNFDYRPMIAFHRESGAALTMGFQEIAPEFVHLFGMVEFDAQGRLRSFIEKPAHPVSNCIFSAVCIFRADVLKHYLAALSRTDWQHDISRDVIPAMLRGGEIIKGFPFTEYWEDIGTVERYHQAQLALLGASPTLQLQDMPVTLLPEYARRHVISERNIADAIISEDCDTEACIETSIVYPRVKIAPDAVVRNSVLLTGAKVRGGAVLENTILLEDEVFPPG